MYESNIASAYNLISSKGLTVSIAKKTPGAYSVNDGSISNTVASEVGYAVVIKNAFGDQQKSTSDFTEHEQIVTILLSARGITAPYLGDEVTIGAVVYTIINTKTIAPNYSEPIIYVVEMKR